MVLKTRCVHLFVTGLVQGVFYRSCLKKTAESLSVKGWVRNLTDGRVESVLVGSEENVCKVIEWCHRGPRGARVDEVLVEDIIGGDIDQYTNFAIIH